MRLLLFGTAGCHLCEEAERIVHECLPEGSEALSIEMIDIADQDVWQERYALSIPVLLSPDTRLELGWPFDHIEVRDFIRQAEQLAQVTPANTP